MKNRRLFGFGLLIALVVLGVDQATKAYFRDILLGTHPRVIEVTPFLNWVPVWNYGVSFGMFNNTEHALRWVLVGVAAGISTLVLIWLGDAQRRLGALGLGMILGGAIGNIIDRIIFGAVFDFIDVYWQDWHWPAFNVADAGIVIGVGLFILEQMRAGRHSHASQHEGVS
jgi:signal peptidase II